MIFDFGKLKNSVSSSCIYRKSTTSHTKLCNSVRNFYFRATNMESHILGFGSALKIERFVVKKLLLF